MKINIHNLKDGQYFFEFEKSSAELGIEDVEMFSRPAIVESNVSKRKSEIVVFSRVRTQAKYVCDRCLKPFGAAIDEGVTVLFTTDQSYLEGEDNELVQLIGAHTREIDLSVGLRESILLAVPMKHLCSENCKGLCPTCGANLNEEECRCVRELIDPRWEVLRKLTT